MVTKEEIKLLIAFCKESECWLRVSEIIKRHNVFSLNDLAKHIEHNCPNGIEGFLTIHVIFVNGTRRLKVSTIGT